MIHLRRNFREAPFDRVMNPRVAAALDQLMGAGRWIFDGSFGWWPLLLPDFPDPADGTWMAALNNCLTSPEKGVVILFLFSDIEAGDGGTPMVRRSYRAVAHILAQAAAWAQSRSTPSPTAAGGSGPDCRDNGPCRGRRDAASSADSRFRPQPGKPDLVRVQSPDSTSGTDGTGSPRWNALTG